MPHPGPQGREPSGGSRHYPKTEPWLPDCCYHESRQPCPIPFQGGASPRVTADTIPGRHQGSQIAAITNPCDHVYLAQECPPWPRGQGGRPALRTAPMSSRAKTGNARGVPISEAYCAVRRFTSPPGNDRCYPGWIQGAAITIITNLNWSCCSIDGEHGRPDNCHYESTQPCPIPPQGGASPRAETTDTRPSWNQGYRIAASTNPCDHAQLAHSMYPVATGSGGPSGLEDSPYSPRAKTDNARSPQIKSVLAVLR